MGERARSCLRTDIDAVAFDVGLAGRRGLEACSQRAESLDA